MEHETAAPAKRGRPRKATGNGSQVRIASDVASMARLVVGRRGVELQEYLTGILRDQVTSDYAVLVLEFSKD